MIFIKNNTQVSCSHHVYIYISICTQTIKMSKVSQRTETKSASDTVLLEETDDKLCIAILNSGYTVCLPFPTTCLWMNAT